MYCWGCVGPDLRVTSSIFTLFQGTTLSEIARRMEMVVCCGLSEQDSFLGQACIGPHSCSKRMEQRLHSYSDVGRWKRFGVLIEILEWRWVPFQKRQFFSLAIKTLKILQERVMIPGDIVTGTIINGFEIHYCALIQRSKGSASRKERRLSTLVLQINQPIFQKPSEWRRADWPSRRQSRHMCRSRTHVPGLGKSGNICGTNSLDFSMWV